MTSTRERPRLTTTADAAITECLHALMTARATQASRYGPEFAALWQEAIDSTQGGKLLRPRLLIGAFDTMNSPNATNAPLRGQAIELAAALEILHFAFLLHDDLIDGDLYRRGSLNLIGKLAASPASDTAVSTADERRMHWARSSALLIGDLMLTIAHQVFARARIADGERVRLLDLLDATVTESVAGEYVDVALADGQAAPTLSLVLDMTRMKTAAYTFELPLRMAAIIAGAPAEAELRLGSIGTHLGIAFQLQDDLLSAFEPSQIHGKDPFSDFREGKETALIAYARMTNEWGAIERILGAADFTVDSGRTLQHLLESSGARGAVETMISDHLQLATGLLVAEDRVLPPETCQFLLALMSRLEGRHS